MSHYIAQHGAALLLWGFIATCTMLIVQEGSQYCGLSRMSFPYLIGTFFTGNRRKAEQIGFVLYLLGGFLFTLIYAFIFETLGRWDWGVGALIGLLQSVFLLVVILPFLPTFHPRMASPYDGPELTQRIEPPGFMGMHYGWRTPIINLIGQISFGIILGITYR